MRNDYVKYFREKDTGILAQLSLNFKLSEDFNEAVFLVAKFFHIFNGDCLRGLPTFGFEDSAEATFSNFL